MMVPWMEGKQMIDALPGQRQAPVAQEDKPRTVHTDTEKLVVEAGCTVDWAEVVLSQVHTGLDYKLASHLFQDHIVSVGFVARLEH